MKTKAIITILASLMVGFILGFITEGQLVKREKNKWHRLSYSRMFEKRIMEIISPTEEQKEQITPVIRSYSKKMSDLRRVTSQKLEELRSDMHKELKTMLTDEQLKRLQERKNGHTDRRRSTEAPRPSRQNSTSDTDNK